MARKKLDPKLIEILKTYGEDPEEALWDCHGVWVVYHKAIERIAAKATIVFDPPQIVEARAGDKIVAIVVTGRMGDRSEWSFGEAAPPNNKNSYPYAMAEKRAKDRVVLKLVGLHGSVYSEDESDDFKPDAKGPRQTGWREDGTRTPHSLRKEGVWEDFERELGEVVTRAGLEALAMAWSSKAEGDRWPQTWKDLAREEINKRKDEIINGVVPDEDDFPGDRPNGEDLSQHPINAG